MLRRLAVIGLALVAPPALAQVDPSIVEATAGYWFLADADTGKGCNLHLLADEAIGGHAVEAPANCKIGTVSADDIAAWNFDGNGGMVLIDAVRHVLFRVQEQEYGAWTSDEGGKSIALTPSEDGVAALPVPRLLTGTWTLRRPDGPPLCSLTLADKPPPGGEESFALSVADGCDTAIRNLHLATWRVEGVTLMLYGSDGHSLALLGEAAGGYRKAPKEGGKPLVMTKAP